MVVSSFKISNLTNIFQLGWFNHQLVFDFFEQTWRQFGVSTYLPLKPFQDVDPFEVVGFCVIFASIEKPWKAQQACGS